MPKTEFTTINSSPIFTSAINVQAYTRTGINIHVGSLSGGSAVNLGGSFTGTITLQRSNNNGVTYGDVDSWTAATESISANPEAGSYLYRLGCKSGEFTSGEAVIRLESQ